MSGAVGSRPTHTNHTTLATQFAQSVADAVRALLLEMRKVCLQHGDFKLDNIGVVLRPGDGLRLVLLDMSFASFVPTVDMRAELVQLVSSVYGRRRRAGPHVGACSPDGRYVGGAIIVMARRLDPGGAHLYSDPSRLAGARRVIVQRARPSASTQAVHLRRLALHAEKEGVADLVDAGHVRHDDPEHVEDTDGNHHQQEGVDERED